MAARFGRKKRRALQERLARLEQEKNLLEVQVNSSASLSEGLYAEIRLLYARIDRQTTDLNEVIDRIGSAFGRHSAFIPAHLNRRDVPDHLDHVRVALPQPLCTSPDPEEFNIAARQLTHVIELLRMQVDIMPAHGGAEARFWAASRDGFGAACFIDRNTIRKIGFSPSDRNILCEQLANRLTEYLEHNERG